MSLKNLLNLGTFICANLIITSNIFAQYSGGDGSAGSPYQISNFTDLLTLSNTTLDWNKSFIQTADIDATTTQTMNGGAGLNRIGNYISSFSGSYNGNDHKISNLLINVNGGAVGLFGYVNNGGTITNLGVENATVTGSGTTGILIGDIQDGGTISNCYTTGTVSSSGSRCGGLVGNLYLTSVENCYSEASVNGTNSSSSELGGLIGLFNPANYYRHIFDCYATGDVTGSESSYIGGLIGNTQGNNTNLIYRCYSTGNVQGKYYIGGLLGMLTSSNIQLCYATGNVNGQISAGGLIGQTSSNSNISRCFSTGNVTGTEVETGGFIGASYGTSNATIKNCYSTGNVVGVNAVGGFCGVNGIKIMDCYSIGSVNGQSIVGVGGFIGNQQNDGMFSNCFWNLETANQTVGVGNAVLAGSTTEQMKTQDTFTNVGWNFDGTWFMNSCANYGYPSLTNVTPLNETSAPTGEEEESFCFSSQVSNLYAVGSDILWYSNPTDGEALPNNTSLTSGTTYYASQTVNGCESVERLGVAVTIINFSNEVTVDNFTISAVENDAVYYWFNCETNEGIDGEFNQSFTATENGLYAVTVSKNGCSIDSDCVTFSTIGMDENQYSTLKLFPNPTSSNLSIQLEETMENATIFDLSGKAIKRFAVEGTNAKISVEDLKNGVYFIEILTYDTNYRTSFVKQ